MKPIDQPAVNDPYKLVAQEEAATVMADPLPIKPNRSLFLWLVGSHFVMTCGLFLWVYYEMIRTGATSPNVLVFDIAGCLALYLAAGLIAAGHTKVRGFLFASAIALAQAAWVWRWLPGWWLIPAFGAALAAYGLWAFRARKAE